MTASERALITLRNALECATDDVTREDSEFAIQALEKVQQFEAIGTIERFRELTEKAEPKKPVYSNFDENELGEIIPYKATCPTCGFEFEFGTWNDEENHHCECGQRMNWE